MSQEKHNKLMYILMILIILSIGILITLIVKFQHDNIKFYMESQQYEQKHSINSSQHLDRTFNPNQLNDRDRKELEKMWKEKYPK